MLPFLQASSLGGYTGTLLEFALIVGASGAFFFVVAMLVRRVARIAGAQPAMISSIRDWSLILWFLVVAYGAISLSGLTSALSLLTVSGLAGLIVSLALQSSLGNIISGVLLLRDGVLRRGDEIEYSGAKGRVIRIALRNTWVLTDAGAVAVIGNTSLAGGPLINHSAKARLKELNLSAPPAPESPAKGTTKKDGPATKSG